MSEWFWFVLKFPLLVFLVLVIGAFIDPSVLKIMISIYGWPFGDGCSEDLFRRKFARRLGITILCWCCAGTALFCWLKWGSYEPSFWTDIMGVKNVNQVSQTH